MITLEKLIKEAKRAAELSYSPYSKFHVGAAVEVDGDMWYSGTNIENASYGLTICAERVAICKAVSHGHTKLKRVIVYGPSRQVKTAPCGACRQFIKEFANEETRIHGVCDTESTIVWTMEELLPQAFGPENLLRRQQVAVVKPEDAAKDCRFCGQFPCPDHKPFYDQVEKRLEQFAKKCIYCHDRGFFRDDLSGGESFCTCAAGVSLKGVKAE
jgi:cytidine deaminase